MNLTKPLLSVLVLFVAGCGSSEKTPEQIANDDRQVTIEKFEEANRLLDEKQYAEAAKAFDSLRVDHPTSQLDYFIIFNAGIAYQSMNDCATAAERYRQVIRLTPKVPRTQTLARVRLSDTLICLGDDKKAMVNLNEVYRNRKYLIPEIGEAEVPARLAAAYARDGNIKMAERFFKLAEAGLAQVRATKNMPKERNEIMARTLFMMGNMSQLNPATLNSTDYFGTVKSLQKFLYRAVEMNVPEWSEQALSQLNETYEKTWHYLDSVTPPAIEDKVVAKRSLKEAKNIVAKTALATMQSLFRERVPSPDEPQVVRQLMSDLRKQEAKIESFMAMNIPGNEKTQEAERVESVKQEGRFKK